MPTVRSVNATGEGSSPVSSIRVRGVDIIVAVEATLILLLGGDPKYRSRGYNIGRDFMLADMRRNAERILCKDLTSVMTDAPPYFKANQLERAVAYACAQALISGRKGYGDVDKIAERAQELLKVDGVFEVERDGGNIRISPSFVEYERERTEREHAARVAAERERAPVVTGSIDDFRAAFRCDGGDD